MQPIIDERQLSKYLPYKKWRPGQLELAKRIYKAIERYEILFVAYPVGSGKTAATLAAALAADVDKIIYIARTKSQFQAPIREIKKLRSKGLEIGTVIVRSKQDYCPLRFSNKVSYREFLVLCSKIRNENKCPYSRKEKDISTMEKELLFYNNILGIKEARKIGKSFKTCPYEVMLTYLRNAKVLVASYPYIFSRELRNLIIDKGNISLKNSVIIIDEAHNIIDTLSSLSSIDISRSFIREIRRELKVLPPDLSRQIGSRISMLYNFIKGRNSVAGTTEVDPDTVLSMLPTKDILNKAIWILEKDSLYISKMRKLLEIVNFLEKNYHGILVYTSEEKGEPRLHIELYDPSKIAGEVFMESRSAVMLSATMPPSEYLIEMLGIRHRQTAEVVYPYIWGDNAEIFLVSGITSRYTERSERTYKRYGTLISLLASDKGLTLIVTPSYAFMHSIFKYLRVSPLIVEKKSIEIEEIESRIKKALASEGKVAVLATAWGKLVEGIEFTDGRRSIIDRIIVAGLPVAEPSLRNQKMLEKLQSTLGSRKKAWEVIYVYPGIFKVVQAIGRGLRSKDDKVKVYVLDDRAAEYLANYLEKYGFQYSILTLRELLTMLGYT